MKNSRGLVIKKPVSPKKTAQNVLVRPTQLEQHVGAAIRRLRNSQRLSVRTLANKSGFSASFISQVELYQASPSLASLERIASGLGVTLGQFFVTTGSVEPAPIKASNRPMLQSEWSSAQIESLSRPGAGRKLEVLLITLRSGGSSGGRLHARETELFAIVLAGAVQLHLKERVQALRRGDAITIPPGSLHRWENKGAKDVQLLMVIPRFGL
jgi:XRE family transcriptional regulator, regulator of sulfur utilization